MAHDPEWLRSGDIKYVTARDIVGVSPYTMDHLLHEPQVSSADYGSHMPGVEEVVAARLLPGDDFWEDKRSDAHAYPAKDERGRKVYDSIMAKGVMDPVILSYLGTEAGRAFMQISPGVRPGAKHRWAAAHAGGGVDRLVRPQIIDGHKRLAVMQREAPDDLIPSLWVPARNAKEFYSRGRSR